jgi:hypothetical protein
VEAPLIAHKFYAIAFGKEGGGREEKKENKQEKKRFCCKQNLMKQATYTRHGTFSHHKARRENASTTRVQDFSVFSKERVTGGKTPDVAVTG